MAAPASVQVPKKYLWLVAGFVVGSYIGFSELADLIAKVGADVKGAVVEPESVPAIVAGARTPPRPSAYRFYRTPESK